MGPPIPPFAHQVALHLAGRRQACLAREELGRVDPELALAVQLLVEGRFYQVALQLAGRWQACLAGEELGRIGPELALAVALLVEGRLTAPLPRLLGLTLCLWLRHVRVVLAEQKGPACPRLE